eukprot:TRINITY_DN2250_c0_g1_i1.p1 TRINITY_DN2250_c0_g1~~TRINITY_DN2250_c0_g1_i1.p1  ORF type:complete len:477 (-),score=167.93 TRINITY_DN2250_c0_g1_i1:27-1400(-)
MDMPDPLGPPAPSENIEPPPVDEEVASAPEKAVSPLEALIGELEVGIANFEEDFSNKNVEQPSVVPTTKIPEKSTEDKKQQTPVVIAAPAPKTPDKVNENIQQEKKKEKKTDKRQEKKKKQAPKAAIVTKITVPTRVHRIGTVKFEEGKTAEEFLPQVTEAIGGIDPELGEQLRHSLRLDSDRVKRLKEEEEDKPNSLSQTVSPKTGHSSKQSVMDVFGVRPKPTVATPAASPAASPATSTPASPVVAPKVPESKETKTKSGVIESKGELDLVMREAHIGMAEKNLQSRENALEEKEQNLQRREKSVIDRENNVARREKEVAGKTPIKAKNKTGEQELALSQREEEIKLREESLNVLEQKLKAERAQLVELIKIREELDRRIKRGETILREKNAALHLREAKEAEVAALFQARVARIKLQEEELNKREKEIKLREESLAEKARKVALAVTKLRTKEQ